MLGKEGYPGSLWKFFLNLTAVNVSYNGAWWYFTIYILFLLTSTFWFRILANLNPLIYFGILLIIYFVAFYFRIYKPNIFESSFLNWIQTQSSLYFCTLFQFMAGAFASKYNWNNKVCTALLYLTSNKIFTSTLSIIGIIILVIIHGIIPNSVIAPFTGIGFIFLFLQLNLSDLINKILDYFNPHSTNLWLIHMFFYMIYFKELIYAPQYPLLIFGWLVFLCLISSYFINFIYNKIEKLLL